MRKHAFEIFGTCLSVLAIFLFVSQAMAMAGWTRTYPGESMDILTPTSIAQTNDGGYVTAISGLIRRIDNLGYPGHFSQYDELQILKFSGRATLQ